MAGSFGCYSVVNNDVNYMILFYLLKISKGLLRTPAEFWGVIKSYGRDGSMPGSKQQIDSR